MALRHHEGRRAIEAVFPGPGDRALRIALENAGTGVPDVAHDDFAVEEHLLRFGTRLPIDHVVAERLRLGDGAVEIGRIELVAGDAVAQETGFHGAHLVLPHRALARIFLGVEEIGIGRRLVGKQLLLIGEHEAVGVVGDAVLPRPAFADLGLVDDRIVDLVEQALIAELVAQEAVAVADVPDHRLRFDHRLDLAGERAAAVDAHRNAAVGGEGLAPGLAHAVDSVAAEIGEHDLASLRGSGIRAEDGAQRRGDTGRGQDLEEVAAVEPAGFDFLCGDLGEISLETVFSHVCRPLLAVTAAFNCGVLLSSCLSYGKCLRLFAAVWSHVFASAGLKASDAPIVRRVNI